MSNTAVPRRNILRRNPLEEQEAIKRKNTEELRAKLAASSDYYASLQAQSQSHYNYLEEKENIDKDVPSVAELYGSVPNSPINPSTSDPSSSTLVGASTGYNGAHLVPPSRIAYSQSTGSRPLLDVPIPQRPRQISTSLAATGTRLVRRLKGTGVKPPIDRISEVNIDEAAQSDEYDYPKPTVVATTYRHDEDTDVGKALRLFFLHTGIYKQAE